MTVAALCEKHNVELGRSVTVQLPAKLSVSISTCRAVPESDRAESDRQRSWRVGFSASELAAQEFPDLDVSLRGGYLSPVVCRIRWRSW